MSEPQYLPLRKARQAALVLATATAFGGSVGPIAIGTGGLVGASLLPPDQIALATIPVTTFVIGSAIASIPAALAMRRIGRRAGFMSGALLGALGAVGSAASILLGSFVLFALAMAVMGASNAFIQQYRFAAADASEPSFKPKAISFVLVGGVVTGVLGPQVSIHTQWITPNAPLAGPFFVLSGLFVAAALVLSRLVVPAPAVVTTLSDRGRTLGEIVLKRKFIVALIVAISTYSLMSYVMTATPLAMVGHHHHHADAQLAIQWHAIAMFAPSFFCGSLIQRFGKVPVAASGLVLIALAAVVALSGTSLMHFWVALILLGVGWNFGFIAATAMVAGLYKPEESGRVQATNEFLLFGTVAMASFASGKLLAIYGWETMNLIVFPVVGICLLLMAFDGIATRRERLAAGIVS
jgi:MFS family permease